MLVAVIGVTVTFAGAGPGSVNSRAGFGSLESRNSFGAMALLSAASTASGRRSSSAPAERRAVLLLLRGFMTAPRPTFSVNGGLARLALLPHVPEVVGAP